MDGGIANNTPISHAVALGADEVWVLSTGHACGLSKPPRTALAMMLHAFMVAIEERLNLDILEYAETIDLKVVPPLCPVNVLPTDFSQSSALIDAARAQTVEWMQREEIESASGDLGHSHR
jgi:NTE family protein